MTANPAPRPEFDTRLAAYCVVVRDGHILLALWDMRATDPDFRPRWTLPGGGVELGEAIEDGAVRELAEATGYEVRLRELLGVVSGHIPAHKRLHATGRALQTVAVLYEAEVVGGDLAFEHEGSTSEARWFPLEELDRIDRVDRVDEALELYRARGGARHGAR